MTRLRNWWQTMLRWIIYSINCCIKNDELLAWVINSATTEVQHGLSQGTIPFNTKVDKKINYNHDHQVNLPQNK